MKPKAYFILKATLIVLAAAIISLFALFLISFVSFALRANGILVLPIFGFRGFGAFLTSVPWLLIILSAFLIFILEILFRHFSFTYRRPILYSVMGVIILVLLGSFIIDRTSFHPNLFDRAQHGRLPIFGPVYRGFGGLQRPANAHFGTVTEILEQSFIIKNRNEEAIKVFFQEDLTPDIKIDDTVMVFGEKEGDTVIAEGIIKVNIQENLKPFRQELLPPMPPERNR